MKIDSVLVASLSVQVYTSSAMVKRTFEGGLPRSYKPRFSSVWRQRIHCTEAQEPTWYYFLPINLVHFSLPCLCFLLFTNKTTGSVTPWMAEQVRWLDLALAGAFPFWRFLSSFEDLPFLSVYSSPFLLSLLLPLFIVGISFRSPDWSQVFWASTSFRVMTHAISELRVELLSLPSFFLRLPLKPVMILVTVVDV